MSNMHENMYNNLMSNYTEGTFNAVCLSGFISQDNTGASLDVIDGFLSPSDSSHQYRSSYQVQYYIKEV